MKKIEIKINTRIEEIVITTFTCNICGRPMVYNRSIKSLLLYENIDYVYTESPETHSRLCYERKIMNGEVNLILGYNLSTLINKLSTEGFTGTSCQGYVQLENHKDKNDFRERLRELGLSNKNLEDIVWESLVENISTS